MYVYTYLWIKSVPNFFKCCTCSYHLAPYVHLLLILFLGYTAPSNTSWWGYLILCSLHVSHVYSLLSVLLITSKIKPSLYIHAFWVPNFPSCISTLWSKCLFAHWFITLYNLLFVFMHLRWHWYLCSPILLVHTLWQRTMYALISKQWCHLSADISYCACEHLFWHL